MYYYYTTHFCPSTHTNTQHLEGRTNVKAKTHGRENKCYNQNKQQQENKTKKRDRVFLVDRAYGCCKKYNNTALKIDRAREGESHGKRVAGLSDKELMW